MSLDPNGYIFVSLWTYSTGMNHGKKDGAVLKLDANAVMIWAYYYGGENEDDFVDVTTDNTTAYLIGNTNSVNLNTGIQNMYILRLNSTNGNLLWQRGFGGTSFDLAASVTLDTDFVYIGA